MKTIMISIRPEWIKKMPCNDFEDWEAVKTFEIRKTKPNCDLPFECLIYETKNNGGSGKVVGEFICDKIVKMNAEMYSDLDLYQDLCTYDNGGNKRVIVSNEDFKIAEKWLDYELQDTGVKVIQLRDYLGLNSNPKEGINCKDFYLWHISNLKIYNEPKELWNYKKQNPCYYCKSERTDEGFELDYCWDACGNFDNGYCDGRCSRVERPPQSWFYVEED